ncbi:MAG: prepilin-type N-terminal cleavage/methylation domain-containing protein [Gemmatimonadales bacterium]
MIRRSGLTLIEIVVALLVFSVGGLGLAAASAAIARQMSVSALRARSAALARARNEASHSVSCTGLSAGEEHRFGLHSSWSVSVGTTLLLDQQIERRGSGRFHTDEFHSAVPCD